MKLLKRTGAVLVVIFLAVALSLAPAGAGPFDALGWGNWGVINL